MSYVDASRSLIHRSSLLYDFVEPAYSRAVIARGKRHVTRVPAPGAYTRDVLPRVARQHGLRVLVETGADTGDTVLALSRDFDRVVSVELSPQLHAAAVRNTAGRRNVELLLGDSADAREFHDCARSGHPGVDVVAAAAQRHGYTMTESEDIFFLLPPAGAT